MFTRMCLAAFGCAAVIHFVPLHATVLVPAEFREIVTGADVIAYGRVADTTVDVTSDRARVDTLVTLDVGTYLKGGPGETLVFRVPGGESGRYRHVMVGAPQFRPGEEAIVFLNRQADGEPVVFGLNQGVFRVRLDRATKRRVVVPAAALGVGAQPQPLVRGAASRRPVALETFGAQVQTVLVEAARRGR